MLRAMGWQLRTVPFYFKVRSPFRFFRNIEYLRNSWWRKLVLDFLAFSGLGWLGLIILNAVLPLVKRPNPRQYQSCRAEQVSEFSSWATALWEDCHAHYAMAAVRDARVLNILYPGDNPRFIRVRIVEDGRVIGWAVLLDTKMSGNKYFGDMRVGSIIDCLALPENAHQVIFLAAQILERRGVDLVLSNQGHAAWGDALRQAGFFEGPTNYLFLTSIPLTKLLGEMDPAGAGVHMTRGDGDGPIHL